MAEVKDVSERRVYSVLAVSRSVARDREERGERRRLPIDEVLAARIARLIAEFPTYGYRRLWAVLHNREGVRVNRKAGPLRFYAPRDPGFWSPTASCLPRCGSLRTRRLRT